MKRTNDFEALKAECYELNMEIPRRNLALYTWGNVSIIDRNAGVFAIKPSGVSYDELKKEDIVIVDLQGAVVDGSLKPSSDTQTHAVLYRDFKDIGGVVHTHSTYAVGWAQALEPIVIYGTTHADHTIQDIPCTPPMSDAKIEGDYEVETGVQIVEHFRKMNLDPNETQMVLVGSHGPFTWGVDGAKAVYNAVVVEELAKMATITRQANPQVQRLKEALRRKHYERKHGPDAYYGQG
ncbi:MAG: L-ribulose-5-phosphate 4-epimerase [Spirochaetaceae bacterium]|nr:L-ribulose-5-phosphate 4-epimerase [Spirochaetaceae bacterium]MDT8298525.1 L-ribulose-5-phosphate 4-epimerase [Spirochaetaceae bacterium]